MTILVFLKAAADLAFYYTFAGTAAVLLGGSPAILLASLGIQSLCVSASYAADRKACGIREKSSTTCVSPPCALTIAVNLRSPAPSSSARSTNRRQ